MNVQMNFYKYNLHFYKLFKTDTIFKYLTLVCIKNKKVEFHFIEIQPLVKHD